MGITRADLYARADDALYQAKREGRTAIRVFDPTHDDRPLTGERLAHAARAVIEVVASDGISPVYQPIVDVQTGMVVGFEGLSRPQPQTAFEDAASMFTVAEASGRTADLDWVCIRTIVAGAAKLEPHQTLSLNLSPMTIEAPEFQPQPLLGVLARAGISPDRIILEITERQGIEQLDTLRTKLGACRAAGFRIAIDDLGAGNSGLRLLSQIHFDIVKIDLSLVQAGTQRAASLDIVRTLMELAERWGAYAVAEGVETAEQLRMLRTIGLGPRAGVPARAPDLRAEPAHHRHRDDPGRAGQLRDPPRLRSVGDVDRLPDRRVRGDGTGDKRILMPYSAPARCRWVRGEWVLDPAHRSRPHPARAARSPAGRARGVVLPGP